MHTTFNNKKVSQPVFLPSGTGQCNMLRSRITVVTWNFLESTRSLILKSLFSERSANRNVQTIAHGEQNKQRATVDQSQYKRKMLNYETPLITDFV